MGVAEHRVLTGRLHVAERRQDAMAEVGTGTAAQAVGDCRRLHGEGIGSRTPSAPITIAPKAVHRAWTQMLAKAQRPVSVAVPSPATCTTPVGAKMLAAPASGSSKLARAAPSSM